MSSVETLPGAVPVTTCRIMFWLDVLPGPAPLTALPSACPAGVAFPPPCGVNIFPSSPWDAACCGLGAPVTGCGENSAFSAPSTDPCGLQRSRCIASRLIAVSSDRNAASAFPVDASSNTAEMRILCGVSVSRLTRASILSRSALAFAVSIVSEAAIAPASHATANRR